MLAAKKEERTEENKNKWVQNARSLPLSLKRLPVCKYSCSFFFKQVEFSSSRKRTTATRACMYVRRLHLRFRKLYRRGETVYITRAATVPGFRTEFRHLTNVPSFILNRIREKCSALPPEREMLTH